METKQIQNNTEKFTVLRIKRKRTEESPSTLIVNEEENDLQRKKIRKDSNKKVFKLVDSFDFQTFKEKETSKKLKEHLANIEIEKKSNGLEDAKNELMRNKIKESKAARYKVISKNRALKTGIEDDNDYQLFDVVKEDGLEGKFYGSKKEEELMCNFNKMVKEYLKVSNNDSPSAADNDDSQDNYVYDIYVPVNSDEITESDNAAPLIWEELDDNIYDFNEDDNSSYDSEDSNAEDYYQNEYPSSEDDYGGLYSSSEDDSDYDDSDNYEEDYNEFRGSYYPYKNNNNFYNNYEYTEEDYDEYY